LTQATAAVPQKAGERSRIVWWAHVARALAALVVVFARFVVEFREQDALVKAFTYITPIPLSSLPTTFAYHVYQWPRENLYIDPGTAAVGMFFMLSGFVIPFALERRTLVAFGLRRILRVYPTLWAATALSIFFIWLTTRGQTFPLGQGQVATSGTLVAQYGGQNWIDPSYWTIPIEELFYLSAAILAATRLLRRPVVLVGAIALISAVGLALGRVLPTAGETPDWTFWTRFWVGRNLIFMTFIYAGVSLHMLYRGYWSRRTFAIVVACIVGIFYFSLHHGPFQPPYLPHDSQAVGYFNSFVVGLGIFLVFYLIGNRIPKSKPVETLGNMSYEVYLSVTVIGWTILAFLTRSLGYFWALPLATAAVLVVAYLLYRLVEKPTYDLAQRITAHPRFRTASSWSDPPGRRRRRRARPGIADPVREPIEPPEPSTLGLNLASPPGNGGAAAAPLDAEPDAEPSGVEPTS
jgi:peptidoglycan/LPS O-acetylase OafA/YrhL